MKDNIFRNSSNQHDRNENIHNDAFEIIDTGGRDKRHSNTLGGDAPDMSVNDELLNTMNQFEERLDNVDCGCGAGKSKKK